MRGMGRVFKRASIFWIAYNYRGTERTHGQREPGAEAPEKTHWRSRLRKADRTERGASAVQ